LTENLFKPEVRTFIEKHENANVHELLLKHKMIEGVPISLIVDQIAGRKKAIEKLPQFYGAKNVLYPPVINLEQSSSETTALFKAEFVKRNVDQPLNNGVDLTGGFGVDTYYLSDVFDQFIAVEPNNDLLEIAKHNHLALSRTNISYYNLTAEAFLQSPKTADFFYIDPSRRSKTNQKVFSLSECTPDILQLQQIIFSKSNYLLVKTSPLLDIQLGLKELHHVKKVVVLSVDNECKELLFFSDSNFNGEPEIAAVNLGRPSESYFNFSISDEQSAWVNYGEAESFLYEPNAAILKAGAFKLIASRAGLKKLHQNTHLYTSEKVHEDFDGRIFRVIGTTKPDPKILTQYFPEGKANITVRNYPLTVEELRKKTKLKDGGETYLIGFTDVNEKKVLVAAERVFTARLK
jgi:hypothetical protein